MEPEAARGATRSTGQGTATAAAQSLERRLAELREQVEAALRHWLLPAGEEIVPQLQAACEYAVLGGGKRLRPVVTLLVAHACGGRVEAALAAGAALELVHCYSLVHDDLPAMDDDDFRRGRPTCHKVYGDAIAILAGDALLTRAFEVVALGCDRAIVPEAVRELAHAAGVAGMVNGQAGDLLGEGQQPTEERVRWIHLRKTAAMFRAAATLGARCAGAAPELVAAAGRFGETLGLAFQVVDDLLGKSGDPSRTGKPVGKDDERGKLTYPAALGEAAARRRAAELTARARQEAEAFPQPAELAQLALGLQERLA
ncbi:MAG: polyprenyl synthetase family protein [Planctomycetes bacterium]|nr:polyprenyl synthetase family protein [Planctomycetota bacterium]